MSSEETDLDHIGPFQLNPERMNETRTKEILDILGRDSQMMPSIGRPLTSGDFNISIGSNTTVRNQILCNPIGVTSVPLFNQAQPTNIASQQQVYQMNRDQYSIKSGAGSRKSNTPLEYLQPLTLQQINANQQWQSQQAQPLPSLSGQPLYSYCQQPLSNHMFAQSVGMRYLAYVPVAPQSQPHPQQHNLNPLTGSGLSNHIQKSI